MPRVTFDMSLSDILLGVQDLSPPFIQCVLFFFEMPLLPLQAPSCGNELSLKAFLVERFLWDNGFLVTEAGLLFGYWHIVVVLLIFVSSAFGTMLTLFPLVLFGCGLDRVFGMFTNVQSLVVSGGGITIILPTQS